MTQRASGHPRTTDLAGDLDHGFSLPASWYTDPAIVELERERIFLRSWQYWGRTAQVDGGGRLLYRHRSTCPSWSCGASRGCGRSSTCAGTAGTW